jgi:hypothetical protein
VLEGRINKDKTDINNDTDLIQNDVKKLEAKLDKEV